MSLQQLLAVASQNYTIYFKPHGLQNLKQHLDIYAAFYLSLSGRRMLHIKIQEEMIEKKQSSLETIFICQYQQHTA